MEETELESANPTDKIQKKKRVLEDKGTAFYWLKYFDNIINLIDLRYVFEVKSTLIVQSSGTYWNIFVVRRRISSKLEFCLKGRKIWNGF